MDGIINVLKPSGVSSFRVVKMIKRITSSKKVGHCGTLDPMATGVLLICVGKACKSASDHLGSDKEYEADIVFGISTDSGDSDGKVTASMPVSLTGEQVEKAVLSYKGDIEQVPPMVSALHHKGQRLYELARQGKTVERAPRSVKIYDIGLLAYEPSENPKATIRVSCSKGTYIRTLCEDIGKKLGVPAHETRLVRLRSGKYRIENSLKVEDIEKAVKEGRAAEIFSDGH